MHVPGVKFYRVNADGQTERTDQQLYTLPPGERLDAVVALAQQADPELTADDVRYALSLVAEPERAVEYERWLAEAPLWELAGWALETLGIDVPSEQEAGDVQL